MRNPYVQVQNETDSPVQLSIRAVRSILLYCRDWDNNTLSIGQRLQALTAGQTLCDMMVTFMRNDLPEREQRLLMTIFTQTSIDMHACEIDHRLRLHDNERALNTVLNILTKKH